MNARLHEPANLIVFIGVGPISEHLDPIAKLAQQPLIGWDAGIELPEVPANSDARAGRDGLRRTGQTDDSPDSQTGSEELSTR
jgi:hypothetical protein